MSENPVISIGTDTIGNFTQVAKDFLTKISQKIRHIDQQKDKRDFYVSCASLLKTDLFCSWNFANATTPLHYSKTIDEWSTLMQHSILKSKLWLEY